MGRLALHSARSTTPHAGPRVGVRHAVTGLRQQRETAPPSRHLGSTGTLDFDSLIDIRPVHPEEYEEAGRVTASAWEPWDDPSYERFSAYLVDVASRVTVAPVFVAVDDGAILGSVTLEMHERLPEFGRERGPLPRDEAHVRSLGVAPSARRNGVARKLMLHCIAFARNNGKAVVTLNTGERNIPAQHLYESMGFKRGPDLVVEAGFSVRSYRLDL